MRGGLQVKPTTTSELYHAMVKYHENLTDDAVQYLRNRGFKDETVVRFQLGWTGDSPLVDHPANRISIPSLGAANCPSFMSFRAIDSEAKPKYLHVRGVTRIFNPRAVVEAGDQIHITEGQLDAIVLEQCGLHACGVLGAKAWKKYHARVFAGFKQVYVWVDSDQPGRDFGNAVCDSLASARMVSVGEAKDVNELYLAGGEDAIREALTND
jgi:DNA primase